MTSKSSPPATAAASSARLKAALERALAQQRAATTWLTRAEIEALRQDKKEGSRRVAAALAQRKAEKARKPE
jgi:hypothetical protein